MLYITPSNIIQLTIISSTSILAALDYMYKGPELHKSDIANLNYKFIIQNLNI